METIEQEQPVSLYLFRYMIRIWETYERETENVQRGMAKQENFLYPPILPIVYYEGTRNWNVPLDFRRRIREGKTFGKYVPDFEYYLTPAQDYSNETLMAKRNEISLVFFNLIAANGYGMI